MLLITTLGILVVVVVTFLVLTIWQPSARNQGIEEFPDRIRYLLAHRENGSYYRYEHRESDVWFSFERLSGTDTAAVLALRIPRREWTEDIAGELRRTYESHGFEFVEEEDNLSLIARVLIPVADIWNKASGARGAHAGRLLLETIGIPKDARFKGTDVGKPSRRALDNKELLERY